MKLEYMREFLDLAETQNYSLSSGRLFISQPTLTRHVQAMEKELGVSLVCTTSHGISFTKSGEEAIFSFRKIVDEYDRLCSRMKNISQQVSGTIRIGILYYSMDEYFSEFLEQMREHYPNVHFIITNYQPQPLYEDLMSGKVDVASLIFYDLERHRDLRLQRIGTQGTLAIMRPDHVLANADTVTLEELAYSDLISLKNDMHSNEITGELLENKKIHFRNILYTDNIETVPMMVRKTGAIHLTGESCKKQRATGVCYKDVSGTGTRSIFCLAALPSNENPLISELFHAAEEYYH